MPQSTFLYHKALIDRAQEARCFHAVSARGLGPRLLGDFAGGRVEEYIHGRVGYFPQALLILEYLLSRGFYEMHPFTGTNATAPPNTGADGRRDA